MNQVQINKKVDGLAVIAHIVL